APHGMATVANQRLELLAERLVIESRFEPGAPAVGAGLGRWGGGDVASATIPTAKLPSDFLHTVLQFCRTARPAKGVTTYPPIVGTSDWSDASGQRRPACEVVERLKAARRSLRKTGLSRYSSAPST